MAAPYRAAAALTLEYFGMGAARVVFDYCFLRPSHVDHYVDRLDVGTADSICLESYLRWRK